MREKEPIMSNFSVKYVKSKNKSFDSIENLYDDDSQKVYVNTRSSSSVNSKTVDICTMCGRFKGYRIRRSSCIILSIAMTLLILILSIIILFYAIIPAIVRSTIDRAQLSFRSINIEHIEDDRFHLRAQLELSRTGSIRARILAPLIIDVDRVGTIRNDRIIEITGDSKHATVVPIDSPFIISSLERFHEFTRSLIFQSMVTWHLTAKASIKPISNSMPLYSNIPFDKKIRLNGLNKLGNVQIKFIDLRRSTETQIFVDIIIEISNPSIFTIDLGALQFTLSYNNFSIGYVQSVYRNITLIPGINVVEFNGELQSTTNESYDALALVIENFLTGKTSHVEAIADLNSTSYSLLAVGMNGLSLNISMCPFDEQLISSLVFNSMSLIPSTSDKTVKLSASITFQINSPLGRQSPLAIHSMSMNVSLEYENNSLGLLIVSQAHVQQIDAITFQSKFNDELLILTDTGRNYEKFAQDFIKANKNNPINFHVVGRAAILGSFALGPLDVNGVAVDNQVYLEGLDGLRDVKVHEISVNGETEDGLALSIDTTITNPGVTDVQLKYFTLYMADDITETVLGRVPIDVLALEPGNNSMVLNGVLTPLQVMDLPVIGKFFSAYLNNQTQRVRLFHQLTSIENATGVELTVSGLSLKADLNGIETKLIRQVEVINFAIEFDSTNVNKVYVTGQLSVLFQLPSNVNMKFKALTTSINYIMRFNNVIDMAKMKLSNLIVAEHNQTTNEILINFSNEELIVLNENEFQNFAANLVLTDFLSVTIEGLAEATAQVQIGKITLTDIPVTDSLHLIGYNKFDNGLLNIVDIDILNDISAHQLTLRVKTEIENPSVVNIINGGRLSLDLRESTSGLPLGLVIIEPFYLQPKGNRTLLNAIGTFEINEKNFNISQKFISNMVSGIDNRVELFGKLSDSSIGTSIPLLSMAIEGLHIETHVPGLYGERALVRQILLKKLTALQITGIPFGLVKALSTRIRLKNPFGAPLTITNMNLRADYGPIVNDDQQVGIVADNSLIKIDSYQEMLTPYINVTITAKLATMIALLQPLLAGIIPLSISGSINVIIGNNFNLIQLPLTLLNVTSYQES